MEDRHVAPLEWSLQILYVFRLRTALEHLHPLSSPRPEISPSFTLRELASVARTFNVPSLIPLLHCFKVFP
jgi:hypothetical protein